MKKILKASAFLALAGLITTTTVFGQRNNKLDNSVLWEVSGNGLTTPSYLFGTIHMICSDEYVQFNKLDSVFNLVNTVAVELDVTDPKVQMEMAQGLMSTDGKKLSEYFTAEEYKKLDEFVKANVGGVSVEVFEPFHPAILVSLLAQGSNPCDSIRSYDMEIISKAKAEGKELSDLDPVSVQTNALKSMPMESILESIKELISGDSKSKSAFEMKKLVQAYRTENLKKLSKVISKSDMSKGNSGTELLDKRNLSWIPKIETMMKTGPSLITFGAAHFTGDTGIIKLLREKGYAVKPIKK